MMMSKTRVATGLALGLGLMYFFNPARGAARRAMTRERFTRIKNRGANAVDVAKHNISDWMSRPQESASRGPRRQPASLEG